MIDIGNIKESENILIKALKIDEYYYDALSGLFSLYMSQQRLDEACYISYKSKK